MHLSWQTKRGGLAPWPGPHWSYGFELYFAHPGKAPECTSLRSNPSLLLASLGKIDFIENREWGSWLELFPTGVEMGAPGAYLRACFPLSHSTASFARPRIVQTSTSPGGGISSSASFTARKDIGFSGATPVALNSAKPRGHPIGAAHCHLIRIPLHSCTVGKAPPVHLYRGTRMRHPQRVDGRLHYEPHRMRDNSPYLYVAIYRPI